MPRNPNLIPTTVTDKNGRVTTVHKKPQSSTSASSMPAVSMPAKKSVDELKKSVTDRVLELIYQNAPQNFDYRSAIMEDIQGYPENALRNIDAALQEEDGNLAMGVANQISNSWYGNSISNSIHYYHRTESTDYWQAIADVSALSYYHPTIDAADDFTAISEDVQQQHLAVIKLSHLIDTLPEEPSPFLDYIDDLNYDVNVINNSELVDLVLRRPEDVEQIAEIVLHYRTSNAATINGILEGEKPVIAEGHL